MRLIGVAFLLSRLLASDTQNARDPASDQLVNYHRTHAENNVITTSDGIPINDKLNSLTVGERGPMLLQDSVYIDEAQHFNRERIPERVVHAKGAGAFGYFVVTDDIRPYTKATVFQQIGKKTHILMRFSSVAGERGSADTVRDPRGFAIKFYTEDGNWDLVGNNTPVFFVRDAIMFFSFIHSQKRNPVTNLKDFDAFWDFLTLRPESMYQQLITFSDRGIPNGHRHMHGYGSNTFKLVNAEGRAVYCKFHMKSDQGLRNLTASEAEKLQVDDPDYSTRDLYNAIATGNFPSWTFYIQVMTFEEAERFRFNPFDVTKIWPENEYPLIKAGKLVLDRNPTNYFTDIEQAGFSPSNMIPGIEPSPDKMLQGRLFSYADTHLHRLGTNYRQIPVNSPFRSKVRNVQRDGAATFLDNQDGAPNYFPSSFDNLVQCSNARLTSISTVGDIQRYNSSVEDDFTQPGIFYREELDEGDRTRLIENIANHLIRASKFLQERAVRNFGKVDPSFGQRVRTALRL